MRAAHHVSATVGCASISIRVILIRRLIGARVARPLWATGMGNRHLAPYAQSPPFSCAVVGPHGTLFYSYENTTPQAT